MVGNMLAVIGGQYGSEGKGVVVSSIANEYNIHVRVGSPNAGHTFFWNGEKHVMQVIPCGWINEDALIIIGRGALINIPHLLEEIRHIERFYPKFRKRLLIDNKAAILQEKHAKIEGGTSGKMHEEIGSTGEGVGAARIDRIRREPKNFLFWEDVARKYGLEDISVDNTPKIIANRHDNGNNILLEGTQGSALSLIHGPWPFVTSIDTNSAQLLSEVGISPFRLNQLLLVARTYPIRVAGNSGPMKGEITWEVLSKRIDRSVSEKTTVTKKIRRIAEWDDQLFENAVILNKPTSVALTFLDYIDPSCRGVSSVSSLTDTAKKYVKNIENKFGVKVSIVGTGGETFSTVRLINQI